jgi:hypothetical protein
MRTLIVTAGILAVVALAGYGAATFATAACPGKATCACFGAGGGDTLQPCATQARDRARDGSCDGTGTGDGTPDQDRVRDPIQDRIRDCDTVPPQDGTGEQNGRN